MSCPPLKPYSAAEQARAADELERLPPGSAVGRLVVDYGTLREQVRACRGAGTR